MLNFNNPENITIIVSLLGGLITFFSVVWVKIIKPIVEIVNTQNKLTNSLDTIKNELTTNGGNSLKDTIIDLRKTCHSIESRQKIIEQRTKAALHYTNIPLFETDKNGRLVWTNSSFYELTADDINSVDGYDWLGYIMEEEREELFREFKSCLEMNRKFVKTTKNCNQDSLKLVGFPYKINEDNHGGFIVSVSMIRE